MGYYDYKLEGWYDTRNKEDAKVLSLLMKNLDKAIRYMKNLIIKMEKASC